MAIYIAQRIGLIVVTVLVVSFGVFAILHTLPGDAFVSERVHGAALAQLRHAYGLDQPIPIQYWNFLVKAVHGDFGVSLVIEGQPIAPVVIRELSVSMELGGTALIITIGLGMLFGILAAIRQNTWVDYLLTTIAVVGYSVPSFVLATMGILVFGLFLHDLTGGAVYYPLQWTGTYGDIVQLSLPAVVLGLYTSGQVTRITRASMLEVIQQDYIRTARAKGLRARTITLRHALRNAMVPVVSILGPLVVSIIAGSTVIETVFGIPGLGKEFVQSIQSRDYNITVAVFTIFAALIGVANLVVDLVYAAIDPRIRY